MSNEAAGFLIRRVELFRQTAEHQEFSIHEVEALLSDFLDVLLVYGAHKPDCAPPEGRTPDGRCDCGLKLIKEALSR